MTAQVNVYWRSNFLQKKRLNSNIWERKIEFRDVDLCYAPFLFITIKVYITLCISAREKVASKVNERKHGKKCFRLAIALLV